MDLIRINNNQFYTIRDNGRDRNGNSKYLINVFQEFESGNILDITFPVARKNNIKLTKNNELSLKMYKHQIDSKIISLLIKSEE